MTWFVNNCTLYNAHVYCMLSLQILNSYMRLIMDKHEDVYIFSTFLYTKLSMSGYQGMCNWAKTIKLFTKRFLMVPLHLSSHWCLVAVDMTHHKISLHDSLANNNLHCMDIIEQYLVLEAAERNLSLRRWTQDVCKATQQHNFNDCGVYVCMNGRNIAEQSTFKFYLDISRTRKHIEHELLCSKLLDW